MALHFDQLHTLLNLGSANEETNLEQLEHWYTMNVSKDVHYEGSTHEKYVKYSSSAKHYLDHFLPASTDLATAIVELNSLNPIQYAAEHGYHYFIVNQELLDTEVVNQKTAANTTALHLAVLKGYPDTVAALLTKGANPEIRNGHSQLPLHTALHLPLVHNKTFLSRKIAIFEKLWAAAPDTLTRKDSSGNTVFHLMALKDQFVKLMDEVLKREDDATIGIFICNNLVRYPIHIAILNAQIKQVERLFQFDPSRLAGLVDENLQRPLHYAARYGNAAMLDLCCQMTSNIDCLDGAGKTPLLLAAEAGNLLTLEVLVAKGADVTKRNPSGFSILDLAIKNKQQEIVCWIKAHTILTSDETVTLDLPSSP